MDDRPALLPAPGVSLLYQPDGSWAALVGYAQFTQEAPSWSGPGPDPSTALVAETTHFRVPGHKPRSRTIAYVCMACDEVWRSVTPGPCGRCPHCAARAHGSEQYQLAARAADERRAEQASEVRRAELGLEAETTHVRVPGHRHRPCAHGTEGAAADPSICSVCVHEREERIDETCRQVRAEAHRERLGYTALHHGPEQYQRAAALAAEAQLQRDADEWVASAEAGRLAMGPHTGYRTNGDHAGEYRSTSTGYSRPSRPAVFEVVTLAAYPLDTSGWWMVAAVCWNDERVELVPVRGPHAGLHSRRRASIPFVEYLSLQLVADPDGNPATTSGK